MGSGTNLKCYRKFDVPTVCTGNICAESGKCVILKEKSNIIQQCIKILLFHIYMKLNMFWATHRPSSEA
jgi:hypothetical protein